MPIKRHESHNELELTETVRLLVLGLQEVSEKLAAVLPQKVVQDEQPPEVDVREEHWGTVHDSLEKRNKNILETWKDELNNLLVFAGLFSAIVTAFTTGSFALLQQDSGAVTITFLAHLSLQLSNSSTPALPLETVNSSFQQSSSAVLVNVLWVLSLTLSLISAFFAIAVQQWLRQLNQPSDLPVRRAVQLVSQRFDGLQTWQVPGIISLLPLLLQISVVLFLGGLFITLQALNATVTFAFAITAGVGLLTFLVSTLVPLIDIRCPYKSPLVPTILIVLQWLTYPFALFAVCISFPGVVAREVYRKQSITALYGMYNQHHLDVSGVEHWQRLLEYVRSFGRHMYVNIGRFWHVREYRHIYALDDDATTRLECASLVDVLLSTHGSSFTRAMQCLHDFEPKWWQRIFLRAAVRSLSNVVPSIAWESEDMTLRTILDPDVAGYVRKWLSDRHSTLGSAVAQQWVQGEEVDLHETATALAVMHEIKTSSKPTPMSKTSTPQLAEYARHLLHIYTHQHISSVIRLTDEELVPASLIFDMVDIGYPFSQHDTQRLVDFTEKCFSLENHYAWHAFDKSIVQIILVSSTSALAAMAAHPSIAMARSMQLISNLADFMWNRRRLEMLTTLLSTCCKNSGKRRMFTYNTRKSTTAPTPVPLPRVLRVLTMALKDLAIQEVIPQGPYCPSLLLLDVLRITCTGWEQEDLLKAREHYSALEAQLQHVLEKQSYPGQPLSIMEHMASSRTSFDSFESDSYSYDSSYSHSRASWLQGALCESPTHCAEPLHMIVAPSPDIAGDIIHVV